MFGLLFIYLYYTKRKISKIKLLIPILFFGLVTLSSCLDEREKLIKDYEERIGDTITDLSLKISKLEFVGTITGLDSANILIINKFDKLITIDSLSKRIMGDNIRLTTLINELQDENGEFIYDDDYDFVTHLQERIRHNTKLLNDVNNYNLEGDKILVNKWECIYTIKNPRLNGVKQTITKTYGMDSSNQGVLTVLGWVLMLNNY